MLILVRKVQQGVWIEGDIWVKVLSVERDRVKLGITAPGGVKVMRTELLAAPGAAELAPGGDGVGAAQVPGGHAGPGGAGG